MSRNLVSGELNESLGGNDNSETDIFINNADKSDKNSVLNTGVRKTGHKSAAKSLRESIGFISTNKFGEGRRVYESDDEKDTHVSIKMR